jgi:hypothetical protein
VSQTLHSDPRGSVSILLNALAYIFCDNTVVLKYTGTRQKYIYDLNIAEI